METMKNVDKKIEKVYLAPKMQELEFIQNGGEIHYKIPYLECHQMVVLDY